MEKIIFFRNSPNNFGGIENQILELAKKLYKNNILEPILIASQKDCVLLKKFKKEGFKTYIVPLDINIILSIYKLNSIVRKIRPKIIQTHMFKESIISRFIKFLNPELINIYRVHVHIYSSWISYKKKMFYYFLDNITSNYVDNYVCISHNVMEELRKNSNIKEKKLNYITDSVPEPSKNYNRDKIKYSNIAMISNLYAHKGHDCLLESVSILKNKYNLKINLKIIGGENTGKLNDSNKTFTNKLIKMAKELSIIDQISFCGYVDNIYDEIKDAGIVVLPSEKEGTPNSLLEAMSMKKIVIASRVGGIPEFIINGVNGFLHKPKDSEKLAFLISNILKLSKEDKKILTNNAYLTWKKNYHAKKSFTKFIDFYNSI